MDAEFLIKTPIAHRGLHDETKPENSLPAFLAAMERGYAIETDVRFTKDKRLVVFHDDTLLRMTGDPRPVSECMDAELRSLALKSQNGAEIAHIPLFSELLQAVDGKVPLLVEIKSMPNVKGKEIAAALSDELKDYRGNYAVQSFDPFYVKAYKKICPEVPCGILGTAEKGVARGIRGYTVKHMPFNFLVKPDFLSYRKEDLPRGKVSRFKGLKLAWVVRSPEEENWSRNFVNNVIFEHFLPRIGMYD